MSNNRGLWTLTRDPEIVNGLSVVDEDGAIISEPYLTFGFYTTDMPGWCAKRAEDLAERVLEQLVRKHNKETV